MSLLRRDRVIVFPEIETEDGDLNPVRVAGPTAVPVRGLVQPLTATEATELGQTVGTTVKFICRSFPGGAFARVVWGGRDWDVIGEPQRRPGASRVSKNDVVILKARGPEPLGA